MSKELIRIEKHLSQTGIASRREAQALLKAGLVFVNGKVVRETGIKIDPDKVSIKIHGQAASQFGEKETVAVYKPRGVLSSKDKDGVPTVFDTFPQFKKLNTVGRLDKESEGLLLLSNDGLITKSVTGKDHIVEKEYIVTVREDVTPAMMARMTKGLNIRGGKTKPAVAVKVDRHTFRITLTEGKKHQIRRMANACNLTVESLKRLRVGPVKLGRLQPGQWKKLSKKEFEVLRSTDSLH